MRRTIRGRDPFSGRSIEVGVENGRVQSVLQTGREEEAWLSPGLIDLQVNGYGGEDVNLDDPDPDVIVSLTKKMIGVGVTTYLPTIITAREAKIVAALQAVAEARRRSPLVADVVPYVHVEGPSITPEEGYRGAHPKEHVRAPKMAEFLRWQEASDGLVGMVTLSPHWLGVEKYISGLSQAGVHVALGHTNASAEQIQRAADAGARLSTHLGNGSAGMMPRHANVLWPQLADDRLTASLIADGHHLPADMLKTIVRAKTVDRCILVSDTVSVAGLPPGRYQTAVGGEVELHLDGRLNLAGTEFFAGAAVPVKDGIAKAVSSAGVSLAEAVKMATVNPGRFVGCIGVARPGVPADLIRFTLADDARGLNIETVWLKGEEWSGG